VRPSAAAWPSSLWARWLGWTALYGLLYAGAYFGAPFLGFLNPLLPHLVGLALAFLIGLRFRSWSWALGPPAGSILGYVAVIVIAILQTFFFSAEPLNEAQRKGAETALGMIVAFSVIPLMLFAGVNALVAAAGVGVGKWWSERRE
jgi:hypothetical protein